MKKIYLFLLPFILPVIFLGCLTFEAKEYSFNIKKDGSGKGTIKYINIMSDNKDSAGVPEADYEDLINNYLNGNKPEDEFAGVKNVKKRLFEEDNQLCAEFAFEFNDIKTLGFYKYKENGPWCYYIKASYTSNEEFFSSNGTWGGEKMPVIFWDGSEREFEFKTTVTSPGSNTISLIDLWRKKGEK
jgi:hypothetical protein